MKVDPHGQMIFSQEDLCDMLMQGQNFVELSKVLVDSTVEIEKVATFVANAGALIHWYDVTHQTLSVAEFDRLNQQHWYMPDQYKELDIAEYLLNLCETQAQLQRVGQELLMYQERDLFNLLRYLKYLVDVMKENNVIWGVGRGSGVASYVLYLLEIHKIDSMYYDLDINEFLR
jgi:DNA polymerase III alpha subunit